MFDILSKKYSAQVYISLGYNGNKIMTKCSTGYRQFIKDVTSTDLTGFT